jgi:TolA-binding protein
MTRNIHWIASSLILSVVVGWGCTKPESPKPVSTQTTGQLKALETRVAKLETQLKSEAALRTQLQGQLDSTQQALTAAKSRLVATEEKLQRSEKRAQSLESERNEALLALQARTAEKDSLQVQYDDFRKTLKDLIGKAELTAAPTIGTSPANVLPAPRGLN